MTTTRLGEPTIKKSTSRNASRYPPESSGGHKQPIGIARTGSRIVALDEPVCARDVSTPGPGSWNCCVICKTGSGCRIGLFRKTCHRSSTLPTKVAGRHVRRHDRRQ
jgi:hypothetical protein